MSADEKATKRRRDPEKIFSGNFIIVEQKRISERCQEKRSSGERGSLEECERGCFI